MVKNHDNRKFDYGSFVEEYGELFDSDYECVVLNGLIDDSIVSDYQLSVQSIKDIYELNDININNTAIIICINQENLNNLKDNIHYLLYENVLI